jgi:hypothetical protein
MCISSKGFLPVGRCEKCFVFWHAKMSGWLNLYHYANTQPVSVILPWQIHTLKIACRISSNPLADNKLFEGIFIKNLYFLFHVNRLCLGENSPADGGYRAKRDPAMQKPWWQGGRERIVCGMDLRRQQWPRQAAK